MKKISILSALAILFSTSVIHAQILKKDVLIGGSFGVGSNGATSSPTNTNANISPRIGYAIGNNSVLYANLGYSFYKSKSDLVGNENISNSFSAGISWKRFIPIKDKFGLYTNLYGSFVNGNTKQDVGIPPVRQKTSNTGYIAGLTPGVYYSPVSWLLLNVDAGGIAYNYYKNKYEGSPTSHSSAFNVNFLNSFTFGVDFILHKKKK